MKSGPISGSFSWRSPSNLALIKYWGKRPGQFPQNPSLSMTLRGAYTDMDFSFQYDPQERESGNGNLKIRLDFEFAGKPEPLFQKKIADFLQSLLPEYPFLAKTRLKISTHNSFPHSAGIASSASSMSALALGLCSLEREIWGTLQEEREFCRKASSLARRASGSACRSLYGDWVLWGEHDDFPGSSSKFAVPLERVLHPSFRQLHNAILMVDSGQKEISSRAGHSLMDHHPLAAARYDHAPRQLQKLVTAMERGDWEVFIQVVEEEAMMLHGLMMSSHPSMVLLKPGSLILMEKIREARKKMNLMMALTLDAGPNVHLLYPEGEKEKVERFIEEELAPYCENRHWTKDGMGKGPTVLLQ